MFELGQKPALCVVDVTSSEGVSEGTVLCIIMTEPFLYDQRQEQYLQSRLFLPGMDGSSFVKFVVFQETLDFVGLQSRTPLITTVTP